MSSKDNSSFLDSLTLFSVFLQMLGYQNDMQQTSNDEIANELHRQNKEYLEKILENQKMILEQLAKLG